MEKLGVFGGSTALSGGEMAVPGNWIQKNSGLKTVPNCSRPTCWKEETIAAIPSWSNVIARGRVRCAQWLTYEGGVSWEHNLLFFGGHTVKRSIIPSGTSATP